MCAPLFYVFNQCSLVQLKKYLRKKRPEKAFLTLKVNYRKIVQKNKLCHSKQK